MTLKAAVVLTTVGDPALLEQERKQAIANGDKERVQALTARILSTRKAVHIGGNDEGR